MAFWDDLTLLWSLSTMDEEQIWQHLYTPGHSLGLLGNLANVSSAFTLVTWMYIQVTEKTSTTT